MDTIFGHIDNLLGNVEIERCENVHQLFHHLRHNVVKQRDQRHRVDDLLHGAPLNPHLRQHLKQRCSPPGGWCLPNVLPGIHRKVLGTSWGEGEHLPERSRVVLLALPTLSWPSSVPWGTVVLVRGQDCSHRLLLVSPPRAQTALPSPPRSSVIAMQRLVDHWGSRKGKRAVRAVTLESERLLLLLFLTRTEECQAVYGHTSLKFIVQEPSMTKNSSPLKAPKNGAQRQCELTELEKCRISWRKTLQIRMNGNCGTFTVFCILKHQASVAAHQRACQQECPCFKELRLWDAPEESAGHAQPGNGPPCQWTATGESQWSAELDQGKRPAPRQ